MVIYIITFRRHKDSKWEAGIRIGESEGDRIFDKKGNEVEIVFDFRVHPHTFSLNLSPLLKELEQIII